MTDPIKNWKSDAALRVYESLRLSNPHLPEPRLVTLDEIRVNLGGDSALPTLSLRVFITLPEAWKDEA